jgi:uncharacterized protein YabN with tetrapyrrole methylase and pyrophosphatase domain
MFCRLIKKKKKDDKPTDEENLYERWQAHQESIYHVTGPANVSLKDRMQRTFNLTLSSLQSTAKAYYKNHSELSEQATEEEFVNSPWDYIEIPDSKTMKKAA